MKALLSLLLLIVLGVGAAGCSQQSACGCGQNTVHGREMGNSAADTQDNNPNQDSSQYGSDVR